MKMKLSTPSKSVDVRAAGLSLSQAARAEADDAAETAAVELSAADRLKGLSAAEIKRSQSDKQRDSHRRPLLAENERCPPHEPGYRSAMIRVVEVARSEHLLGLLQDFDRLGFVDADIQQLLANMAEPTRYDVTRLAPLVAGALIALRPPPREPEEGQVAAEGQSRAGKLIAAWDEPPAEGTVIFLDGQRYDLVAIEPRPRKCGGRTAILTWTTHCPTCGCKFALRTGIRIPELTRRCLDHRGPRPLSSGAGQFGRPRLQVTIIPAQPKQPISRSSDPSASGQVLPGGSS